MKAGGTRKAAVARKLPSFQPAPVGLPAPSKPSGGPGAHSNTHLGRYAMVMGSGEGETGKLAGQQARCFMGSDSNYTINFTWQAAS